jgi:hypothetical protein
VASTWVGSPAFAAFPPLRAAPSFPIAEYTACWFELRSAVGTVLSFAKPKVARGVSVDKVCLGSFVAGKFRGRIAQPPCGVVWKLPLHTDFASLLSGAVVPLAVTGALLALLCITTGSWYRPREARTPLQNSPADTLRPTKKSAIRVQFPKLPGFAPPQ